MGDIFFNVKFLGDHIEITHEKKVVDRVADMKRELKPVNSISLQDDEMQFNLAKDFKTDGINFVAIDLETATELRNSICEIGLSVVKAGRVVETKSWLVKPPRNEYDYFNIDIHGIKPEDTRKSPKLKQIWSEIVEYLSGKVVVCHNSSFDMYVLRDSFLENRIPFPDFVFFCSYRSSLKLISGCYNYSLQTVCEAIGYEMNEHHRAGADAEACAHVFLECLKQSNCNSFASFRDFCEIQNGRFADKYFRPQLSLAHHSNVIDVKSIKGDPSKIDMGNYFYGKSVCFTGKCKYGTRRELLQKIADIGGIPVNSVTKATNILVVGQQEYREKGEDILSSKQKKAMKLKDAGLSIEIMSEADFLSNI